VSSEFKNALSTSLKLLSRRDYSGRALRRKLQEKFPSDTVEEVISYLTENGYLDEERAALNYALSKVEKGWGRRKILLKLLEKGFERSVAERVVESVEPDYERVREMIRKRFGESPDPVRVRRFLTGRGFSFEEIEVILSDKI